MIVVERVGRCKVFLGTRWPTLKRYPVVVIAGVARGRYKRGLKPKQRSCRVGDIGSWFLAVVTFALYGDRVLLFRQLVLCLHGVWVRVGGAAHRLNETGWRFCFVFIRVTRAEKLGGGRLDAIKVHTYSGSLFVSCVCCVSGTFISSTPQVGLKSRRFAYFLFCLFFAQSTSAT